MGIVKEVRKNGAIAIVKNEDADLVEQKYFIPGWAFQARGQRQLTTTQGKGLSIGDIVSFYIDPNQQAKPYDAVAANVDVLKQAEASNGASKDKAGKTKAKKVGPSKKPPVNWLSFLMTDDLAAESEAEVDDPSYEPPEEHDDIDDFDSDISSDELKELTEALGKDLAEFTIIQAATPETGVTQAPDNEEKASEEVPKTDGPEENKAETQN